VCVFVCAQRDETIVSRSELVYEGFLTFVDACVRDGETHLEPEAQRFQILLRAKGIILPAMLWFVLRRGSIAACARPGASETASYFVLDMRHIMGVNPLEDADSA
jgi:hypothetical protein